MAVVFLVAAQLLFEGGRTEAGGVGFGVVPALSLSFA